jgi:hypothetical protein
MSNSSHLPDWLPKTLEESIEYYRDLHCQADEDVLREGKRILARNDLFYLMVHILGREDLVHPWLFERCREVQAEPNGCLDLWGRYHCKSSIITCGLTIQDILNDPEITICIFSHTGSIAKGFLQQIKREFENNAELKALFPDILYENPQKESPKWSEGDGLIVRRSGNPKEATLEASGLVDGQPTGKHFKLRIYDDVVTLESVATPAQIEKTTAAWGMSDNLGMEGGIVRTIGTRYSLHDSYSEMMKRGAVKVRLHPATHNGKMDGKPVLFSEEFWKERLTKQTRAQIASQFLQNPLADESASFQPLWLTPWEVRPLTLNISITCDPSKGLNASSDNTAIIVLGISSSGVKYLLDGYCHRMSLSQRWEALRDLYLKWSATPGVMNVKVGYERYGAQSDDEYFQERMELESRTGPHRQKVIFPIEILSWTREGTKGEQGKRTRIERLEPDFRNSRILFPLAIFHDGKPCTWKMDNDPDSKTFQTVIYNDVEGLTKSQMRSVEEGKPDLVCKAIRRIDQDNKVYDLTDKLIQEYLFFPFGEYKDALDAMSRFYDMDVRPPEIQNRTATEGQTYHDS